MPSDAKYLGLYNRLGEVLGQEHADTLMNNLATKEDLANLVTKQDFAEFKAEFTADIYQLIIKQNRFTIGAMVALTAIYAGVNVALFG